MLALHDHSRADLDAVVEIDEIVIGQANAAGRVPGATACGSLNRGCGTWFAEIERARTERIVWPPHMARQIGSPLSISGGGVRSGHSRFALTVVTLSK